MNAMDRLVGKTVSQVRYIDPWGEGVLITFTDGTEMHITERMQAGEFEVKVNQEIAVSDWHNADEEV